MPGNTLSITESQVLAGLRAVLTGILPDGVVIVRGQANMVPEPRVADFIVMTPTTRGRLATNVDSWDEANPDPLVLTRAQATEMDVQLDIHGPASTDNAQLISTLFRDEYAVQAFVDAGVAVAPLYADDGHQVPFINAENQYEDRWVMNVAMQATPIVSTGQQFADTLTVGLIEVDTTYPP